MAAFSCHQYQPLFLDQFSVLLPNTPYVSGLNLYQDENYMINAYNNSIMSQIYPPHVSLLETPVGSDDNYNNNNNCYDVNYPVPQKQNIQTDSSTTVVDNKHAGSSSDDDHVMIIGTQTNVSDDKKRKNNSTTHVPSFNSDESKNTNGREVKRRKQKKWKGKISEEGVEEMRGNKEAEEKKNQEKVTHDDDDEEIITPTPAAGCIHVRARRGQATDSHSLAERVRREKISEKMKILQRLVPGCDKVNGKALMLDEIINYVQSLQNQVEFLSMKIASFNPLFYHDFGMDIDALMVRPERINSFPLPTALQLPSQL